MPFRSTCGMGAFCCSFTETPAPPRSGMTKSTPMRQEPKQSAQQAAQDPAHSVRDAAVTVAMRIGKRLSQE